MATVKTHRRRNKSGKVSVVKQHNRKGKKGKKLNKAELDQFIRECGFDPNHLPETLGSFYKKRNKAQPWRKGYLYP